MMKLDDILRTILLLAVCWPSAVALGQSGAEAELRLAPEKPGWTYQLNEPARFVVAARAGEKIRYQCGPEFMPPTIEKTVTLANRELMIEAGTMTEPGFLRCTATAERDGKTLRAVGTAGFEPEKIRPAAQDPADFDRFWAEGRAELAKIPIDARIEPLAALSTAKADVFHVSLQTAGRAAGRPARVYGILAVPKAAGAGRKFPAVLGVPGAGVRPYRGLVGLAERGFITLQIGIHGIPVNLAEEVYQNLAVGALNRYMFDGLDDKNDYYYRRVILSCLRANDFLASHAQFDGRNLGVIGGSQGGALAIAATALDARVTTLAAWFPALADHSGYLQNRAGGWPHAFRERKNRTTAKIETAQYYDTVNFARRLRAPGFYTFGYNDEICPPTSMYAAYNAVAGPKTLLLAPETGHANGAPYSVRPSPRACT